MQEAAATDTTQANDVEIQLPDDASASVPRFESRLRRHSIVASSTVSSASRHGSAKVRRHSDPKPLKCKESRMGLWKSPNNSPDVMGEGFFDIFGFLGVPMVLAFIISALAVFNQAAIQIYPATFANWLMNTSHYDEGEFWLLDDAPPAAVVISCLFLIFFGLCYIALAVYMIFFRHRAIPVVHHQTKRASPPKSIFYHKPSESRLDSQETNSDTDSGTMDITLRELFQSAFATRFGFAMDDDSESRTSTATSMTSSRVVAADGEKPPSKEHRNVVSKRKRAAKIYSEFSDIDGVYHSYYSAMYDLPKLIFQTVTLFSYLRKGFPGSVITFYAMMLSFNWIISFYRFQLKKFDRALIIARVFYVFDLFFAVFSSWAIIFYAMKHFHLDHEVIDSRIETLSPGVFDRSARLFVDPKEMSIFRLGFDSIVLSNGSIIAVKVGLLYLSIYKWRKIILYLIRSHHKLRLEQIRKQNAPSPQPRLSGVSQAIRRLSGTQLAGGMRVRKQARHHLVLGIVLFLASGLSIVIYALVAFWSVDRNCVDHPQCVVVSYQWYAGRTGCPCAVFIDRKFDPRTFAEWTNPPDASLALAAAAEEGQLKAVQVVNRAVRQLPEELRHCKHLQQLILIYTATEAFPSWIQDFRDMRYLHIEGNFNARQIKSIPKNAFQNMKYLKYLHTGGLLQLAEYPSLARLYKLKALTITSAHALRELPSFSDLSSVYAISIMDNVNLVRLPDLEPVRKTLKQFVVLYRSEMCCNGFLMGNCNLNDLHCRKQADEPPAACIPDRIDAVDLDLINRADGYFCSNITDDLEDRSPTLASTDVACGGVMYRQCKKGDVTGICYNGRVQVVNCDISREYETMRRLQIQRGVGDPCDPVVEAWLGCKSNR
ncbi:hypothetical protein Poli38472_011368 [Pythium oligandrum]|uniref:WLGC domain-containing protein n=1 Tax=Pythium oligandrum TaxID=41045 RepID=A0A8K1CK82_PYTOL|nr:hypothetical protein Poli38472_011368 [Pythium oligandrum]|eukprot:TMW64488.1 hypothetical protein Poli38472_011368 [Pythium oligandrum]